MMNFTIDKCMKRIACQRSIRYDSTIRRLLLIVGRNLSSKSGAKGDNNDHHLSTTKPENKVVEVRPKNEPRKIVVLEDHDNVYGRKNDQDSKDFINIGADGEPYNPMNDPYYKNEYMSYKYPQYFTKNVGFRRARNIIKEDISIMVNKKRIHKIREEIGCPDNVDVCIFGGGIIGTAIGYFLKEKAPFGLKIAVIERDPCYTRCASTFNTGGLRQQFSLEENILMAQYSAEFIRNARKHLSILDGEPPDLNYHPQGFLTLANESQAEQLIRNHQKQIEMGTLVELYTVDRLREKFPMINTDGIVLGSYGVQNEGWFDPLALLVAFKAKAQFFGVEFVQAEILDFNFKYDYHDEQTSCNYAVIREPNGNVRQIEFAIGVIATGHESNKIAQYLGYGQNVDDWRSVVNFPIEARKRYVYAFNAKDGPGLNFPFLIDTIGTFCRREGLGGNFIAGRSPPTNDEEPDIDTLDIDYSYFDNRILPILKHRVESFNTGIKMKGAWAGLVDHNRIDHNPLVGQDPYFKNLIWATGFGTLAAQMSPAIGRAIMEFILHLDYKTIDLRAFNWERLFNNQPLKEAYRY